MKHWHLEEDRNGMGTSRSPDTLSHELGYDSGSQEAVLMLWSKDLEPRNEQAAEGGALGNRLCFFHCQGGHK